MTTEACITAKSISYTRCKLIDLSYTVYNNRSALRINTVTWKYLSVLGIRMTTRGKRGGKHCKNRPKQLGIHLDLLQRVPTLREYSTKHLKVHTANMKSIRNKCDSLLEHLTSEDIDIMVTTETWLKDSDLDILATLNSCGYKFKPSNRDTRVGGGLGISYKKSLNVSTLEDGFLETFQYGIWDINLRSKSVTVVGIYHPPPSEINRYTDAMFVQEFADLLTRIVDSHKNLLIIGDFNLHVNDTTSDIANAFKALLLSTGLVNYVNFPTHNSGNTLDLGIVKEQQQITLTSCEQGFKFSDHYEVKLTLSLNNPPPVTETRTTRNTSRINHEELTRRIEQISVSCQNLDSVEDQANMFNTGLREALDDLAPEKTRTCVLRPTYPWFNQHSKSLKRYMRQCERHLKEHQTVQDWINFKNARNHYYGHLRRNKRLIISQQVVDCNRDSKKLYKLMNNLTYNTADNPLPKEKSDQELTELFGDFFLEKIEKIRESLEDHPKYEPKHRDVTPLNDLPKLTEAAVKELTMQLKPKSSEQDPLPAKLSRQHVDDLVPIYTTLINTSFEQATFPRSWKSAIVKPLLKKQGMELVPKSYRPVSNLSMISKLTEKAFLSVLLGHMDHNAPLPDYQSAYRRNFSCETSLMALHNDLLWKMENQEVTIFCAMDLSAAFDTVDHAILLNVMKERYGLVSNAAEWLASYLSPRDFRIRINNCLSEPKELCFSVPQGSCLGPQLFSCYASTLDEVAKTDSTTLSGFADDHGLRSSYNPNVQDAESDTIKTIENTMNDIKEWMDSNVLRMNPDKTEIILFGTQQKLKKCEATSLNIIDKTIETSPHIKLLGVWLDESLSMSKQITEKCKIASLNLHKICLIRSVLTEESCKDLVLGTVITHLDYANGLYVGLPSKQLDRLQRIQTRAAKVILRKRKYDSATEALRELHWLKVKYRIDYKILLTVFKAIRGESPEYLQRLFEFKTNIRSLRGQDDLQLVIPRTNRKTLAERSLQVAGSRKWNTLPYDIRNSTNVAIFKRELKTYLFKECYDV